MSSPLDNDAHVRHVLETSRTFIEANDKLGLSPWAGYAYLVAFREKHNIKMLPLEFGSVAEMDYCTSFENWR